MYNLCSMVIFSPLGAVSYIGALMEGIEPETFMQPIETIAVVGAGNMGSGIAQKSAQEQFDVQMVDREKQWVDRGEKIINDFLEERNLLQYRTFGYGHSFGILSHYYGREAELELREDIETIIEPGMVISMEPMLTIPQGQPGAGGYREHDILVITEDGNENITGYPYGPDFNIVS